MIHWKENIFFGRREDGSVRILAFTSPPKFFPVADAIYDTTDASFSVCFDKTIDADSWASIVSSVSKGGEANGRFYTAKAFHESK